MEREYTWPHPRDPFDAGIEVTDVQLETQTRARLKDLSLSLCGLDT